MRSWLLELLHDALVSHPGLDDIRGYVDDSGEGRWTLEAAIAENVPAPITALALFSRFASRQDESYSAKVIAALRNEFGGHAVKTEEPARSLADVARRRHAAPQAIVIFGASGDLTRRKLLPAFFHLYLEGMLPEEFAIVGYARTVFTDDEFRQHARDSVMEFGRREPVGEVWMDFAKHLRYVPGEFSDAGAMSEVAEDLVDIDATHGTQGNRFFYCATPPDAYPDIVKRIGEAGLQVGAKIVFEKPFGRDLASARELNRCIHAVFDEKQVFRIDHYLGKETVQNILAFRFANGLFEPIWNRRYLDHVQITAAESIGIEGRGAFYEQTGAIRDLVSTHLFQMMTFLAMEPPVNFEPDRLRDETVKVLRSAQFCDPTRLVRGQYEGYRSEPGVADDSNMETFAALQVDIDNWRWADVPFYLRTGKGLAKKSTEITLKFRKVPFNVFRGSDMDLPQRDHLTLRIQPDEGITLARQREEARSGHRARPGHDGLRLRQGVPVSADRRVRAAAARRHGRRPHVVPAAGRGRARVGAVGAGPGRPGRGPSLPPRRMGAGRGRRPHRAAQVAHVDGGLACPAEGRGPGHPLLRHRCPPYRSRARGGTMTLRCPGFPRSLISRSSVLLAVLPSISRPSGFAWTEMKYVPLGRSVMSNDCPGSPWK